MMKKVKIFKDLPIEEGKTYKTRFATGDMFFVKRVVKKLIKIEGQTVERVIRYDGIYWEHKDIGVCPLAVDRLIPEKELIGEKIVCDDPNYDLTDFIKQDVILLI